MTTKPLHRVLLTTFQASRTLDPPLPGSIQIVDHQLLAWALGHPKRLVVHNVFDFFAILVGTLPLTHLITCVVHLGVQPN